MGQNGPIEVMKIMLADWDGLSDTLQLALSRRALDHAAEIIAMQAEMLAVEMESGSVADYGGADALRLFAQIVLISRRDGGQPSGLPN
jgi:hypothetical protein